MEHLYNSIISNKFDQNKFTNSNVVISLKVDGTPLQIVFENGKTTFHKRAKDNKSIGERITQMDAFTNPAYYPVMTSIYGAIKTNIGKFGGVKLINTEILIDNNHHKIQYNQKPKGNLCLLNGITSNGNSIKSDIIAEYAKILGVESVPIIYNDVLGNKAQKIINYVKDNCDPHNPKKINSFKDDILNILGVKCNSPLLDTKDGHIEGFVFDFNSQMYKIDDPAFMQMMNNGKNQTSKQDTSKIDKVLNDIYKYVKSKNFVFKKYSNNEFDNLLQNFDSCCKSDPSFITYLYNQGKSCLLGDMLHLSDINVLPKRYANQKGNETFFYALRLFLWLFGKKKTGKNYPILKEFNSFIN